MTRQITRPVTFAYVEHGTKRVLETRVFPAGTEVYATQTRRGTFSLRVCGTLFTQEVYAGTIEPTDTVHQLETAMLDAIALVDVLNEAGDA